MKTYIRALVLSALAATAFAAGTEDAPPASAATAAAAAAAAAPAENDAAISAGQQLIAVDAAEAALLTYLRTMRRLKKAGGGNQYFGQQQYFQPHPGKTYAPTPMSPYASRAMPPMERIDPYTVEGFYAPALWRPEDNHHINVAQHPRQVTGAPGLVYAAAPRLLGKTGSSTSSYRNGPYWGYQQHFTPHPGKVYSSPFNGNQADDLGDYVVLGGPHEYNRGMMLQDQYRTDGVPTGGFSPQIVRAPVTRPYLTSVPVTPPPYADMDGIFPSPAFRPVHPQQPEYVSALYHAY